MYIYMYIYVNVYTYYMYVYMYMKICIYMYMDIYIYVYTCHHSKGRDRQEGAHFLDPEGPHSSEFRQPSIPSPQAELVLELRAYRRGFIGT